MLSDLKLRSSLPPRVRCSSPPREEVSEDGSSVVIPWSSEEETNEAVDTVIGINEKASIETIECQNVIVFDWSEDIFPDDVSIGGKRPLDILDDMDCISGSQPKRRLLENDETVEQRQIADPPIRLRSCLKPCKKLLTDYDENVMTVSERLLWREQFEYHSARKKSVRFKEFHDPENKCRFFARPTDVEQSMPPALKQDQLRDACPQARYMDCTLVNGHRIIRNYMKSHPTVSSSISHNPDKYVKKLSSRENGKKHVTTYTLLHPPKFLSVDVRESKCPNGIRLPALPGKTSPVIPTLTDEGRAFMLSCFRRDMRFNRQNRKGMSMVRHLEATTGLVTGILFLSDSLMKAVEPRKLSNALLEHFHPSQGIEDMVAVINRCSYEELDIRHCVLAWGHDLIVYLKNEPIEAAGIAISVLIYLRKAFEGRRQFFEEQGYRRRDAPQFWLITIPELGDFAQHFNVFNIIMRSLFSNNSPLSEYFQLLDWASEVKLCKSDNKSKSPFTKIAVEERFHQLFELCRQKLDLTFFRYTEQRMRDRHISWKNQDYDGT